eukprot:1188320-Rhodomonas_salina.1
MGRKFAARFLLDILTHLLSKYELAAVDPALFYCADLEKGRAQDRCGYAAAYTVPDKPELRSWVQVKARHAA